MPFCHHKGEVRAWDIVCFDRTRQLELSEGITHFLKKKISDLRGKPEFACNPCFNASRLKSPLRGDKSLCKRILCSRRSEDTDTRAARRNLRRRETLRWDRSWEWTWFRSPQRWLQGSFTQVCFGMALESAMSQLSCSAPWGVICSSG